MSKGMKAQVIRRYYATSAEVFAACTRPDLLARWLGPDGFEVVGKVEADAKVGGRFAFRMKNADGIVGAEGVYQELVPNTRLVLSWEWVEGTPADGVISRLIIDLKAEGNATILTLTHEGLPDQAQADSHENGWGEALDKLARLPAGGRSMKP